MVAQVRIARIGVFDALGGKGLCRQGSVVKLWLDDCRTPPDSSWTWAKNYHVAVALLADREFTEASLDHDLGDVPNVRPKRAHKEYTGYDVVLWMAEHDIWPEERIVIHSWNPIGAENMAKVVDRYGPYPSRCRCIPDQRMDIVQQIGEIIDSWEN